MLAAVLASSSMAGLKLENEKNSALGAGSANMGFLQLLDELLLGNIGNVIVVDRDLVITVKIASSIGWETFYLKLTNLAAVI